MVGGSGFLSQATTHLGLRGYVLDTKFGPRCDVAQPSVLTRIRQGVSAGKMRRRKGLTSTTTHPRALPKLFPPLLPSLTCFIAHAVDSGTPLCFVVVWTCRKSGPLRRSLARPGLWQIFVFLDLRAASKRCFWMGMWTAGMCTVLHESALGQAGVAVFHVKTWSSKKCPQHFLSLARHVTTHPPSPFNFCAGRDSHHERTTIPENIAFEWNGISTQRVKGY